MRLIYPSSLEKSRPYCLLPNFPVLFRLVFANRTPKYLNYFPTLREFRNYHVPERTATPQPYRDA